MIAGLLLVVIALATCGGGNNAVDEIPGPRTSEEIVDCLKSAAEKTNFTISESTADLHPLARNTTDRAVAAELKGSDAMIVIEATEQDADKTREAFRDSKFIEGVGTIEQYEAIVVAYSDIPDPKQRDALFECVGSGTKP